MQDVEDVELRGVQTVRTEFRVVRPVERTECGVEGKCHGKDVCRVVDIYTVPADRMLDIALLSSTVASVIRAEPGNRTKDA
jgi:hypothetical protein